MPLYFIVLLASLTIPALFSIFKIDFIKDWANFGKSTAIVAFVFLVWDAIFTHIGVWGFNDDYCLKLYLFKMPLEEWLFFFIIPFCSLFTHFAFFYAWPDLSLPKIQTIYLSIILIVISLVLIVVNFPKAYTVVDFSFLVLVLTIGLIFHTKLLQQFYISFIIILIPFVIVNGILTGIITDSPVVWYNDAENVGVRFFTIPIEDFGYAFSMLFGNLMIFETLKRKPSH